MELVSFEDLKSILGLELDDISDYPALEVIKDNVVSGFEGFLGMPFEEEARTSTYWPTFPTRNFVVGVVPLVSITKVEVDSVEQVLGEGYKRTKNGIKLMSQTTEEVVITYTGGYSEDTLPRPIKKAALYQTAFEYQQKDVIGSESIQTRDGTTKKPGFKMLDEVVRLLQPYMHPLVVS
jgi:hypothetical protein